MESSILWATIALLALAGWSVTLYVQARVQQSQANALMILDKIDERMNERLEKLVARVREKLERETPKVPSSAPKFVPPPVGSPVDQQMGRIFGGLVDDEQPGAEEGLEVVDA